VAKDFWSSEDFEFDEGDDERGDVERPEELSEVRPLSQVIFGEGFPQYLGEALTGEAPAVQFYNGELLVRVYEGDDPNDILWSIWIPFDAADDIASLLQKIYDAMGEYSYIVDAFGGDVTQANFYLAQVRIY